MPLHLHGHPFNSQSHSQSSPVQSGSAVFLHLKATGTCHYLMPFRNKSCGSFVHPCPSAVQLKMSERFEKKGNVFLAPHKSVSGRSPRKRDNQCNPSTESASPSTLATNMAASAEKTCARLPVSTCHTENSSVCFHLESVIIFNI